jgi:hypothetical protein
MADEKKCTDCTKAHDCKSSYEAIGKATGPSVVCRAIVAFLFPIMVFIAALTAFTQWLPSSIDREETRTGLGAALAMAVTFIYVLTLRSVSRYIAKRKKQAICTEGD